MLSFSGLVESSSAMRAHEPPLLDCRHRYVIQARFRSGEFSILPPSAKRDFPVGYPNEYPPANQPEQPAMERGERTCMTSAQSYPTNAPCSSSNVCAEKLGNLNGLLEASYSCVAATTTGCLPPSRLGPRSACGKENASGTHVHLRTISCLALIRARIVKATRHLHLHSF